MTRTRFAFSSEGDIVTVAVVVTRAGRVPPPALLRLVTAVWTRHCASLHLDPDPFGVRVTSTHVLPKGQTEEALTDELRQIIGQALDRSTDGSSAAE